MKALLLKDGKAELIELRYDVFSVLGTLGLNNDKSLDIVMIPHGIMYIDTSAEASGAMRNDCASLVAQRQVYGAAIIAGCGGDDVSEDYVSAYLV